MGLDISYRENTREPAESRKKASSSSECTSSVVLGGIVLQTLPGRTCHLGSFMAIVDLIQETVDAAMPRRSLRRTVLVLGRSRTGDAVWGVLVLLRLLALVALVLRGVLVALLLLVAIILGGGSSGHDSDGGNRELHDKQSNI
jgi:hypothetical protein